LLVFEFLAQNSIKTHDHPPYSADLAPCDVFLFPKCKMLMRGQQWDNVETKKRETTRQLKSITFEGCKGYFDQWKRR